MAAVVLMPPVSEIPAVVVVPVKEQFDVQPDAVIPAMPGPKLATDPPVTMILLTLGTDVLLSVTVPMHPTLPDMVLQFAAICACPARGMARISGSSRRKRSRLTADAQNTALTGA